MDIQERAADVAGRAAGISGKVTYAAAATTTVFGMTLNDMAIIVGIVATIVTAGVNWYYRAKHARLAEERMRFDGQALPYDA